MEGYALIMPLYQTNLIYSYFERSREQNAMRFELKYNTCFREKAFEVPSPKLLLSCSSLRVLTLISLMQGSVAS